MGDLSANFSLSEFTRSGAAVRHRLDNTPDPVQRDRIAYLVTSSAQPWRDHVGRLSVSGGFVMRPVNEAIRDEQRLRDGTPSRTKNSRHLTGGVADFLPREVDRWYAWGLLVSLHAAGLLIVDRAIIYDDKPHIHLEAFADGDNAGEFLHQVHGLAGYERWHWPAPGR